MHIPDDEKEGRKAALKKLMDMMGSSMGDKLKGLGKPVGASLTIEKMGDEGDEGDEDGDFPDSSDEGMDARESSMGRDRGEEPSEEDKDKIRELYNKWC